ncbi:MAG: glutaminyl-peptide cyclotransferase, partial [Saprospiraceae bacterium]
MRLIILLFSFTIVLICFNSCKKNEKTPKLKYKVLNKYPHNPSSFTQGLLWHNDKLYESTGLEGKSKIM